MPVSDLMCDYYEDFCSTVGEEITIQWRGPFTTPTPMQMMPKIVSLAPALLQNCQSAETV